MAHVEPYPAEGRRSPVPCRLAGPRRPRPLPARSRSNETPSGSSSSCTAKPRWAASTKAPTQPLGEFLDGWLVRYERRVRQSPADRVRAVLPHLRAVPAHHRWMPCDRRTSRSHISALSARAPRQAELVTSAPSSRCSPNAKERGHIGRRGAVFRVRAPRREPREVRFLTWGEADQLAANTDRALRQPRPARGAHRPAPGRAVRAARPQSSTSTRMAIQVEARRLRRRSSCR